MTIALDAFQVNKITQLVTQEMFINPAINRAKCRSTWVDTFLIHLRGNYFVGYRPTITLADRPIYSLKVYRATEELFQVFHNCILMYTNLSIWKYSYIEARRRILIISPALHLIPSHITHE